MNTNKLMASFRFRFGDTLRAALCFIAVMVAVFAVLAVIVARSMSNGGGAEGTFTAFGVAAIITFFVFGICSIREDLRLMTQNGVSRRTMFSAEMLSIAASVGATCAAGELVLAAEQAIASTFPNFRVVDLYQIIYVGFDARSLTFGQHIQSLIFNFLFILCAYLCGCFISMVFYRVSKVWRIIIAVGIPFMLTFGLPIFASLVYIPGPVVKFLSEALEFIFARSFWITMGFALLFAAAAAVCNWLLLRRAPVRAAK